MNYEIMELSGPISVGYVREKGNYFESAPKAWERLDKLLEMLNLDKKNREYYALSHDDPHQEDIDQSELRFDACFTYNENEKHALVGNADFSQLNSGLYAVFTHHGSEKNLGDSYHYIMHQWPYQTNYARRSGVIFTQLQDIYLKSEKKMQEEKIAKIFLPIRRLNDEHKSNNQNIARMYYDYAASKNIEKMEDLLDINVEFISPMINLKGKVEVLKSTSAFINVASRIEIRDDFFATNKAVIIYDAYMPNGKIRGTSYVHFFNNLITKIELFYDASVGREFKEKIFDIS